MDIDVIKEYDLTDNVSSRTLFNLATLCETDRTLTNTKYEITYFKIKHCLHSNFAIEFIDDEILSNDK